jgi:hypothetical protein
MVVVGFVLSTFVKNANLKNIDMQFWVLASSFSE